MLVGSSLIYVGSIFLFAWSPIYLLSIDLLAIVDAMQMSYLELAYAIIQEACPDHMLGRAISLFLFDRASVRSLPSVSAAWSDHAGAIRGCRYRRGLRPGVLDCAEIGQ